MMKSIVSFALKFVPANTIAAIVAEYVTQALQKIKDKERMAKISSAVSATGEAVGKEGFYAIRTTLPAQARVNTDRIPFYDKNNLLGHRHGAVAS